MAKVLHGDAGGNQLNAGSDKAQVYGLKGDDTLISDGKSDVLLVGGGGNDSLIVMGGEATLSGGEGADVFELNYSADKKLSAVIEDLQPSKDKIVVNYDGDTAPQLTSVKSGNDVVWRDGDGNFKVTLKSVRENDYFDGEASNEAWRVLELTNAEREKESLSPLTMSDDLTAGATIRAQEITELGKQGELDVYRHRRPNNEHFSTVLKKVYNNPIGENLEGGARSPEEVVKAWVDSESHKKNILNADYQRLGVGYNYNDEDPSNQRWYWVQLFANNLRHPESISATRLSTAKISRDTVSKFIAGDDEPNTIENSDYGVTISALGGNDSINNAGLNVSISGGADNDTIENSGSFSTVNAGKGDDSINFAESSRNNFIEYASGDGNDTISGFHSGDTVNISGDDEFTPATVGNDMVIAVATDSIKILDAKDTSMFILGTKSNLIIGTEGDDTYNSTLDNATIQALGGDDTIENGGSEVEIDVGAGDDSIVSYRDSVTIDGGAGDDNILNLGGKYVTINGGDDNDTITSIGDYASINGGDGINIISNHGNNSTILGGAGNDYIDNDSNSVTVDAGAGDDHIDNIIGSNVTLSGGAGNDTIFNSSANVTIEAGAGNDSIKLYSNATSNVIKYKAGDGSDTIDGFNATSTLSISGGEFTASTVGTDIVFAVGTESIILVGALNLSEVNVEGTGKLSNLVTGTEVEDNYITSFDGATIQAKGGNDSIFNFADSVSVNGDAGDDYISNGDAKYYVGSFVTLNGGAGNDTLVSDGNNGEIRGGLDNDTIVLSENAQNNLVKYNSGDGIDLIIGFNETSTLKIGDGSDTYSTVEIGNNIVVMVGEGQIFLGNVASLSPNIEGTLREYTEENKVIQLDNDSNTYTNALEGASVIAHGESNTITNTANNVVIDGYGNNTIANAGNNVDIIVDNGNDSISNTGDNVVIFSFDGDDTIEHSGNNSSIVGGAGNDQISLLSGARNNVIQYSAGDGNDTIWGLNANNGVSILGGEYVRYMVGNNLVFAVGTESITFVDAASLSSYAPHGKGTESKFIDLTEDNDYLVNHSGDISYNFYGDGKQPIVVYIGEGATINGRGGDDTVQNFSSSVSISGGGGNDKIYNYDAGSNVSIDGGAGNDYIDNAGSNVLIDGGAGNDYIDNSNVSKVTINGGVGNDTILTDYDDWLDAESVSGAASINGGDGDDYIRNTSKGTNSTIDGGEGNDNIYNHAASVSIDAGAGDDYISNSGLNVSILSGTGDDEITLSSYSENTFIQYNIGDGNDTIWGLDENDSLQIGDGHSSYSTVSTPSGDDIIVKVGNNRITLKNFRDNPEDIIIGESSTSDGPSGKDNDNGKGKDNGDGRGGNDNDGRGTTGGKSTNEGRGSDASGGMSATAGVSASNNGGSSSGRGRSSRINTTTTSSTPSASTTSTPSTSTTPATPAPSTSSADTSKISLNAPTYANNPSGDEVVALIQSGDERFKKLWGSESNDTLYGGAGVDIFIGSKNEGALTFRNVSSEDIVYLSDVSLNDLSDIKKNNDMVTFSLKTGNTFTIQSSDTVSGAIVLSDLTVHLTHPPKP